VQDLGVLRLVRDYFPQLRLHASTQMGIHNSAGVATAARLGLKRVILERQVTLDEIRQILTTSPLEIEVFAHGALCCSRSGVCLLSSWLGGWSGTRGKCKQPCRRLFHTPAGDGFVFSPGDLCTLDMVPDLRDMGVASLKIEGRLRNSAYVRRVVRAYRLMLDAGPEDRGERLVAARAEAGQAPGRSWTKGFLDRQSMASVIQPGTPAVAGRACGRITHATGAGFDIRLSGPLARGDRVRVQERLGGKGLSLTLTRLEVGGRPADRARAGDTVHVPSNVPVRPGAELFHIGHAESPRTRRLTRLPCPELTLDLKVRVSAGDIRVTTPDLPEFTWERVLGLAPAQRHELTGPELAVEFARAGSDAGVMVAGVTAEVEPGLFMAAGERKALRQEFWRDLRGWLDRRPDGTEQTRARTAAARARVEVVTAPVPAPDPPLPCEVTVLPGDAVVARDSVCRVAAFPLESWPGPPAEAVLPAFTPENRLMDLRAALLAAVERGLERVRITDLHGLQLVREAAEATGRQPVCVSSFPLPVCNRAALAELLAQGLRRCQLWVELDAPGVETLTRVADGAVEWYSYGRIPLMATRARLCPEGEVEDERGRRLSIVAGTPLTLVYPADVFEAEPPPGISRFLDCAATAGADRRGRSRFNLDQVWR
jgi:putative protease